MSGDIRLDKLRSEEADHLRSMAREVRPPPLLKWIVWLVVLFAGVPAVIHWWYPPAVAHYFAAIFYVLALIAGAIALLFNLLLSFLDWVFS